MMENEGWPVKYQQSGANDSTTPSVSSLNNGESNNDEKICATAAAAAAAASAANSIDEKPKLPIDPGEPINNTPTISDKASQLIPIILDQMKEFSNTEKYILYLKLFQISNVVDPLRQPLNPLGSRSEINRTISWIKTHLEEDPETSLPKQQVYEEYSDYCMSNQIKSLSQADFGKVMKQVYPKVRARRLGTRGNSRYCYSGLRRCMKLKAPQLPDLADKPLSTEEPCTLSNLTAASWLIVKEWSEIHFGVQFSSLQALARFLVVNHAIGVGTAAANQLTSAAETQFCGDFNLISNNCKNTHSKHREMQLQLQKKIQQKSETGKEQQPQQQQQQRKRKSTSTPNSKSDSKLKKCRSASLKLTTATTTISPIGVGGESSTTSTISSTSPTTQGNNNNNNKPICDKSSLDFTTNSTQQQLAALPDFKSFQKAPTVDTQQQQSVGKVAIPRLTTTSGFKQHRSSPQQQQSSPKKQQQQNVKNSTNKYKAIQPKPQQQQQQQQTQCDNASYNPHVISNNADNIRSQGVVTVLQHNNNVLDRFKDLRKSSSDCENNDNNCDVSNDDDAPSSVFPLPRERLDSISNVDKDAMDEYLGTNNSQHEEELSKYFSSSSSNNNDQSTSDNSTKLSQLRQLLEQHGVAAATVVAAAAVTKILDSSSTTAAATTTTNNISSSSSSTTTLIDPLQMAPITNVNQAAIFVAGGALNGNNSNLIIPTNCNSNSSARRRVSFETPTIATTINHLQQQLQKDDVVVSSNMNNVVVSCGVGNVVGCGIGIAGGGIGVVPPSPNTRRKNFSFTPISPGPQSPINNNNNNIISNNNNNSGRQSKCSSTNVSPFVSPRNTPIPRNKNTNHHQTAAAANLLANRIATTTNNNNKIIIKREHQQINELNGLELLTDNDNKVYNLMSSAPASPMLPQTNNPFNTTTTTTITADNKSVLEKLLHSSGKITYNTNYNSSIQIKSDLSAPTSNEISEFLHNHHQNDPFLCRSQSVPLSQMIKSDFIDDTATANSTTNQFSDFNDYDPIPESAATVDRIINSLDEQQQGNGTANAATSPDVDPFLSQRFDLMSNNNLLNNNLLFGGPCATTQRATLSRSQSIDVKYNEGGGCFDIIPNKYPSRSVPSTPLSFNQKLQQQHQLGFVVGGGGGTNASRSYPSTPALIGNNPTADQPIFNYNNVVVNNSDCLLNGQPIRSAANVATAPGPADANLFSTNIFGGGSSGGGGDVVVDNNIDGHLVSNDDDVEFGAFDGANGAAGLMDENDVLIVEGNFDAN